MNLASKVLQGDVLAAARLMRGLEDELPDAFAELNSIYLHTGKACVVGLAGAPGSGKSTLIDNLITIFRKKGITIGVIAVDPTSAFTGGAILGDRIRMQSYGIDKDVFIRSAATRGYLGGLSKAAVKMIHVMDAMGKDIIFVEAVGSGQGEVDIATVVDTCLIILTPGMGDDIQMMKAGILEAADVFVINKADREGAETSKASLEAMLGMRLGRGNQWEPKIIFTEAISGKGCENLVEEILRHKEFLISSGELEKRRKVKAKLELLTAIENAVKNYVAERVDKGYFEKLVDDLVHRKTDPYSAASDIIYTCLNNLNRIGG